MIVQAMSLGHICRLLLGLTRQAINFHGYRGACYSIGFCILTIGSGKPAVLALSNSPLSVGFAFPNHFRRPVITVRETLIRMQIQ